MPKGQKKAFTEVGLDKMSAPRGGRREIGDAVQPGLVLRIGETGVKSWSVIYKVPGERGVSRTGRPLKGAQRRITLGQYPLVGLEEARDEARRIIRQALSGQDPRPERRDANLLRHTNSVEAVSKRMIELAKRQVESWPKIEQVLTDYVWPKLGSRPIADVTQADIHRLLDELVAQDRHGTAREVRKMMSRLLNYAAEKSLIPASPMAGMKRRDLTLVSSDRVLADDEIRAVWAATGELAYSKHQGKSFSALYADEAGNYPPAAWAFLRRVRSNLRVAPGRRAHIHLTCNPHGRAHTVIYKEFITRAPPWHPFQDDQGEWWVWTTSSLDDNPHIDRESYRRQLLASTGSDKALADAWLAGKWDVLGGVMFDVFDPAVHIIRRPAVTANYRMIIGADWGTAAPATGILLGRLKEPLGHLRQGDIIALDETDTADPADLSLGTGASVHSWAEQLREMMARNGRRGVVVVTDDARGLNGDTVVRELLNCQISAHRPHRKDRVGTWTLIRSMLQAAADGSDRPALWITDRCPHLIDTLPEAPRGTLRPEDIDPKWPRDHWLDGLGYGLRELHQHRVGHGRTIGHF